MSKKIIIILGLIILAFIFFIGLLAIFGLIGHYGFWAFSGRVTLIILCALILSGVFEWALEEAENE